MAIQKTEGIVIKTQPFRSSSLIVTFFSKDFGKLRGLAKGVRLERETRGALYELFSNLDIVYYEKTKSDLHLISEAALLESYESLRTRLESVGYASYFAELVDQLTEIQDPHPALFDLLDFCFRYLPSLPGTRLARIFEIKLLNEIGWLPYLEGCISCHKAVPEKGFFSARQGALLCPSCAEKYSDALAVSREVLAAMRHYIQNSPEYAIKWGISEAAEKELEMLMNRFFLERLTKPFKSRIFLEKVQKVLSSQP